MSARKVYFAIRLLMSFVVQLLLSNVVVARMVLRPKLRIRPGIVRYPTDLQTEVALTWLANLITLTPGTMTLDVSEDRRTLFIHTLDIEDPNEVVRSIRSAFEDHLLELER